jgi:hypothetical protein
MAGSIRKGEPLPVIRLSDPESGIPAARSNREEPAAMKGPAAEAKECFDDPTASTWLRAALRTALERDPVDALNDALALAEILEERLSNVLNLNARTG